MPKPGPGEAPRYTGMVDCVTKTVRYEGFRGLYKGKWNAWSLSDPLDRPTVTAGSDH